MRSLENGIGAIQTEEEETASKRESKGWMQGAFNGSQRPLKRVILQGRPDAYILR